MKKYIWVSNIFTNDDGADGWPPENPTGFIKWFEEKISEVPIEYRESLLIVIGTQYCYGEEIESIKFQYKRLETDQEEDARERRVETESFRVRQQELETLEKLKAKYGK